MSKKRHRNHREASSAKRGNAHIILIWVGAALFSILIALLIGNAVGKEADKIIASKPASKFSYTYTGTSVEPIQAKNLNLNTKNIIDHNKLIPS